MQWAEAFSALQEILVDRIEDGRAYQSSYLASSRLREISPGITRRLADAGVATPIPDPGKYPGNEYSAAFSEYAEKATGELFAR